MMCFAQNKHMWHRLALALIAGVLIGCNAPPLSPAPTLPAPTVAVQRPTPSIPSVPGVQPAPALPPVAWPSPARLSLLERGNPARFQYQWPSFIPDGMKPSPAESRIARDDEVGDGDIGFYLVTFSGNGAKIVIGGGAVEPFNLSGTIERTSLGTYNARIVTQDDQTLIVIDDGAPGTLFVFGMGIARDDLLHVAASLTPIDSREMRRLVGLDS
ncbi:MAG: hypothetical protein J7479_12355 [Roseiflexus sp.]|nr:hypothetical protein [Roseiflexus sp.]